jgi:heme A synthase
MLQKQHHVVKVAPVMEAVKRGLQLNLKPTDRSFTRFAWLVLAWTFPVVLWGAFVRASGAGAGCGNHWPLCDGEVVPRSPDLNKLIEFTHRAMTGIDGILVLILVVWAFRAFPRGHTVRLGATLSGIFLITESLLGAMLVKLEHVASNPSSARAWSLSLHLINTLTLLACLALTAWWASGRPAIRVRGRDGLRAAVTLAIIVVLGISGVIAALGDTLFPAKSFLEGWARDFDTSANIFVRLRIWHPVIAVGAALWTLYYALTSAARHPGARTLAWFAVGALLAQIAAGVTNLLLAAPVWMQLLHLLLADTLWISLVLLSAAILAVPPVVPSRR